MARGAPQLDPRRQAGGGRPRPRLDGCYLERGDNRPARKSRGTGKVTAAELATATQSRCGGFRASRLRPGRDGDRDRQRGAAVSGHSQACYLARRWPRCHCFRCCAVRDTDLPPLPGGVPGAPLSPPWGPAGRARARPPARKALGWREPTRCVPRARPRPQAQSPSLGHSPARSPRKCARRCPVWWGDF